jgi:hypothetical protein
MGARLLGWAVGRLAELVDPAIVETVDARSHRGDPSLAGGSARSVDVEHGLAAYSPLEEGMERCGELAP